jgi:hypothetical protein
LANGPQPGRSRPTTGDRFLDNLLVQLKSGFQRVQEYLKSRASASHPIDDHPEFQAARKYKQTLTPREDVEYGWVCEYAKINFKMIHDTYIGLDEKADTIIRHLTSGTGLLALGSIAFIAQGTANAWIALMAVPSFIVALAGVVIAIQTRLPAETKMPPSVKGAMDYAESFGDSAEETFLGQWHEACEGMAIAAAAKSTGVSRAYLCYIFALILLMIPFVGGAVLKLAMPAEVHATTQQVAPPIPVPKSR